MPKIVLINGRKRSGKDYTAQLLKQEIENRQLSCEIMSFAEPMKFIISETFGITQEQLETYKNNTDEYGIEIKVYPNNQPSGTIEYTNFRTVLQRFGTEAMKPMFDDDVWAELLYERANESECDYILVPDFRFRVEHKPDTTTLKIRNDEIEAQCTDPHPSETELDDFVFQNEIDNTGYRDISSDVKKFVDKLTDTKFGYFEYLEEYSSQF